MPSGKKPPSDPAQAAKSILDQVTGATAKVNPPAKNSAAVELGRKGGEERARRLSPEERRHIAGAAARKRWSPHADEVRPMDETTKVALKNYDWMVRNKGLDDVELHWDSDTIVYGDGGGTIELLCEPGFTPATRATDGVE